MSARTAAVVASWVLAAETTLGKGWLVCVDGPAGAGKTTVAEELVAAFDEVGATVQLVHMDDVYAGWSASTAPPVPARPPSPTRWWTASARRAPRCSWCTWTTYTPAGPG